MRTVGVCTVLIFLYMYAYWFSGIVRDAYGRRAYSSNISVYVYVYWFSGIMRDAYGRCAHGSNILHRVHKCY